MNPPPVASRRTTRQICYAILMVFQFLLTSFAAQQCTILSFTPEGTLTFQVDKTNLYCGLQYSAGLGPQFCWQAAPDPYWNFTNTANITTLQIPLSSISSDQAFFRIACSSTPLSPPIVGRLYNVYGGTYFPDPAEVPDYYEWGEDPAAHGYTFLGSATATATFQGRHNIYIIQTTCQNVAYLDAVQASDGRYLTDSTNFRLRSSGDTADWTNAKGPPDGTAAHVGATSLAGGYIAIDATSAGLDWIKVFIAP